jgi:hypothetical protein
MLPLPSLWILVPSITNQSRPGWPLKWPLVVGPWVLLAGVACSSAPSGNTAARLGYEGCKVSQPLSMLEVMGKDMSGGNEANRAHPDWDDLIAKHKSGDQVYFIDCRRVDPSRIVAGTSLYVLVREGAVIARVAETIHR